MIVVRVELFSDFNADGPFSGENRKNGRSPEPLLPDENFLADWSFG